MAELLTGPELRERIRKALLDKGSARLAIAFWGAGAGDMFGEGSLEDVEIVCNLAMGGTNPDEIERLMRLGAKVFAHDRLHAKFGVIGDSLAFLGSSNASTNGLGVEGREHDGWAELNAAFGSKAKREELNERFDAIRSKAVSLQDQSALLEAARVAWRERREIAERMRTRPARRRSLWDAMVENPLWFEGRADVIAIYSLLTGEEERIWDAAMEKLSELHGDEIDYYWDWEDLPADGLIIDVYKPSRGQIGFTGYYRRSPDFLDVPIGDNTFNPVAPLPSFHGYPLLAGRASAEFRKCLTAYMREKGIDVSDPNEGKLIPVSEFAHYAADRHGR